MQKKGHGIIFGALLRISEHIRFLAHESVILRVLGELQSRLEERAKRGFFVKSILRNHNTTPLSLFMVCRKAQERSVFLGLCKKILYRLLASSMRSIGLFLLLYAGFSVPISLFKTYTGMDSEALYVHLLLCLSSIPLLLSSKTLYETIWRSHLGNTDLFKNIFFHYEEREEPHEEKRWHPGGVIFLAFSASVLGFFLRFLYLLLSFLIFGALCGVIFLPELLFMIICACFPFFSLVSHGTLLLASSLLLLFLFWGWKLLCGKRLLLFDLNSFMAFLMGVAFLLGGWIGGGGKNGFFEGVICCFFTLCFFPLKSILHHSLWRARTVIALHLGGIVCSFWGIWQALFGPTEIRWVDLNRFLNAPTRVTGCFSNPNFLALYLVMILPLTFSYILDPCQNHFRRFFFLIAFLSEFVCLLLTYSRGAWVGFAVAVFVYLLLASKKTMAFTFILPVGCLALLPIVPPKIWERMLSIISKADSSVQYRFYTWCGVKRMLKEHPWGIGLGQNAFSSYYPRYALSGIETVVHTHRLDLQILSELGLSGMIIFAVLLLFFLCALCKGCRILEGRERGEFLGAGCAVIGALIMGCFDHIWYQKSLFFLFWTVFALFFAVLKIKRTEDRFENG